MTDAKKLEDALTAAGAQNTSTKIRITEDHEATGETAAAYDYWRAGSRR